MDHFCSPCYVFHGHWLLEIQAVTLGLHLGAAYQDPCIRREPRKSQRHVVVEHANLAHHSLLLQFAHGPLLHAEHYGVVGAETHLPLGSVSGSAD